MYVRVYRVRLYGKLPSKTNACSAAYHALVPSGKCCNNFHGNSKVFQFRLPCFPTYMHMQQGDNNSMPKL